MQKLYLLGAPWVERSMVPGKAPPMFHRIKRIARPITALAIELGPKVPAPAFMLSSLAIGPCTMRSGATGCVVACSEARLKRDSSIASTAATRTGMCCGLHPAMTALTAICSMVAMPPRGGTTPTRSWPRRPEPSTMLATAPGIGAITGNPSLDWRSKNHACSSAGSAGASMRWAPGVCDSAAGAGTFASSARTFSYNFSARSSIC